MGPAEGLSDADRQKRRDDVQKLAEQTDAKLATVLTAAQLARLRQIRLQAEGSAALNRPEVVEKLALTQDQIKEMRRIQDMAFRRREVGAPPLSDAERADLVDRQRKAEADTFGLLTDEQKKALDELKGAPFAFPRVPDQRPARAGTGPAIETAPR